MWHVFEKHVIQTNSWCFVIRNQIDTLISNLSFGHNLCCKYSNGLCKFNLDIFILRAFQWYKKAFNPMSLALQIAL
jgi:hypothetical protein